MATAGAARPAVSALSALPGVGPALISRLALLGISRPALYDLLGRFGLKKENGS